MAKKTARGLRNNNPGNIDFNKNNKWQGQLGIETDVPPGVKPRFAKFKSMEYGVRAIAVLCITYYDKYDCDTVAKIIGRWAPPVENNTGAYAKAVAADVSRALGYTVAPTQMIDVHDYCTLRAIVCGIIEHENMLRRYSDAVPDSTIDKGLTLAGVEPPKKQLAKTGTMKNATVLGTTGVTAVASGVASFVDDNAHTVSTAVPIIDETAEVVEDHFQFLFIAFGVVVIVCAAWMAWKRWQDRKNGVR